MTDAAILAEIRAIGERLGRIESRLCIEPTVAAADFEQLEILLPVIAATLGSAAWTVSDLRALAKLPRGAGLRAVIGDNGKRLGKLLRRCDGAVVRGISLRRVGVESSGALYVLSMAEKADGKP